MTRSKRINTPEIEVRLLREGITESIHKVFAVVCDNRSRPLSAAGTPEIATFIRSGLKPFQAIAVTSTGTLQRYNLTDRDLAIICSSHQGTIPQVRQVFNILWRADIEPSALQCPIPSQAKSPLQYNCSGKHAGMLAVCRNNSWPLNNYLSNTNPIQILILNKLSELLRMPSAELIHAKDDCGAPTYLMQLDQMASLYAQLGSGESLDLERISRAMTHYPDLISGPGEFDTELMQLCPGELVSKSGAEGIQCISRLQEGMGLVIKVVDGSKRAKYAVAVHLLQQMGWISHQVWETLTEKFMMLGKYKRLEVIGELSMV